MIETAKIITILIFKSKKQVDHSKHINKKRSKIYVLIYKKRHMKEEKDVAPKGFAEYLSVSK